MFPGQQCAIWPAQLWPPRLGIKLLEGAPSREKCAQGVYFRLASQKTGAISLVFAQWVENAQSGHINPATPVFFGVSLSPRERSGVRTMFEQRGHRNKRGSLSGPLVELIDNYPVMTNDKRARARVCESTW